MQQGTQLLCILSVDKLQYVRGGQTWMALVSSLANWCTS